MSYTPFKILSGTTTLNFGSESDSATTTVSSGAITGANIFNISFVPVGTTETSLDDFKLNGVAFNVQNVVDSASFDIFGTAMNNATGTYTVNYFITHS